MTPDFLEMHLTRLLPFKARKSWHHCVSKNQLLQTYILASDLSCLVVEWITPTSIIDSVAPALGALARFLVMKHAPAPMAIIDVITCCLC